MKLREATDRAAAALEAGDIAALARAIEERRKAIRAGDEPTAEVLESGERLLHGLMAWQQRTAYESARLGQVQRYVEFRKPA